ncbi:MAG: zinc-ribbon domain containing protein [Candidatus Improbicoccus devescovinae]|nr:MAG: zinc-ribbon domain containing protein [Candidatus Improbicoccus devescovinae]
MDESFGEREDKVLICKECGKEFVFTGGEQEFYASKGFENEPQRCKECRTRRNSGRIQKEMFVTECTACGGEARVPFQPRDDRPVYCSACFAKIREEEHGPRS